MRDLRYKRFTPNIYLVSQKNSKEEWIIEKSENHWYLYEIKKDSNGPYGDYESLAKAKRALELHYILFDFANIKPWESMANGGTK